MTNKEALDWLVSRKEHYEMDDNCQKLAEAIGIGINAIEQEICEDAISRQAVIDGINEYFHDEYYQRTSIQDCRDCLIEDVIKNMPSVTPQPKSEWQQDHEILKAYSDGASAVLESIKYLIEQYEHILMLLEDDMKDGSATIVTKTKYTVYTEVVEQLKEVLESEVSE